MQIVIDTSCEDYKEILLDDSESGTDFENRIFKAIQNGTPLPKGHGRLIDADEYKEHLYACETNGRPLHIMELDERLTTIDNVPTIIEADTEK